MNNHQLYNSIYKYVSDNPKVNVKDCLRNLNISYTQYSNISKLHPSIPQIRELVHGSRRILSQAQKDELTARLNGSGKKQKNSVPSGRREPRKKVTGQGLPPELEKQGNGPVTYAPYGNGDEIDQLMNEQFKR